VGSLIKDFQMSPRDAKNTTLREYLMWVKAGDKKAVRVEYTTGDRQEIMEHFELLKIE